MSSFIDDLKKEQKKSEPMIGRTVRIPASLDREISNFCETHQIRKGVLYRALIKERWEALSFIPTEEEDGERTR